MSTLAYAALTTRREEAKPGTSTSTSPPGVKTYIDALAALVPAEVLTLHAVILSFTTHIKVLPDAQQGQPGNSTTITAPGTLAGAFYGLVVLSIMLYVVPRFGKLDRLDFFRTAIPPIAFVAWTMLQRVTAFDAVWPGLGDETRSVIALFVAVLLGLAAAALAGGADRKTPPA